MGDPDKQSHCAICPTLLSLTRDTFGAVFDSSSWSALGTDAATADALRITAHIYYAYHAVKFHPSTIHTSTSVTGSEDGAPIRTTTYSTNTAVAHEVFCSALRASAFAAGYPCPSFNETIPTQNSQGVCVDRTVRTGSA